jgi:hypothetical protein
MLQFRLQGLRMGDVDGLSWEVDAASFLCFHFT